MKLKYSAKAHGYWLDGKRCKSPSGIADVPLDKGALTNWAKYTVLVGAAMKPELLIQVAAAGDDKKKLLKLAEDAIEAAGGTAKRDYGTAAHEITEHVDAGDVFMQTPEAVKLSKKWLALLDANDLEVVLIEGVVVHPELRIAGRFDRIVRHKITGQLYILDIKTGDSANRYLHSHCVQLWLYASAPLLAVGPKGDVDFEVTEFEPMPKVSQTVALVAHLPNDESDGEIIPIDIAAGGQCFREIIWPAYAWRNRDDLRVELPTATVTDDQRDNLTQRCRKVAELDANVAAVLKTEMQARGLTVKGCTPEQYAELEALIGRAEAAVDAPFDPAPAATEQVEALPSGTVDPSLPTVVPDEGDTIDKDHPVFAEMADDYRRLDKAARSWFDSLLADAIQAGRTFHMGERKTMRRVHIAHGLAILCAHQADSDAELRACVHAATDVDAVLFPTIPAGAAVSIMSATEAEQFLAVCRLHVAGMTAADYTHPSGLLRWERPAAVAA